MTTADRQRIEGFYQQYNRLMFQIARLILADSALAEDAVSEAFVKLIQHHEKFRAMEPHQAKAYIISTLRTTALNLRKQKRPVVSDEALVLLPDGNVDIESEAVAKESRGRVQEVIAQLPDKLRIVAHGYFVQGLGHEEIARLYGISVSASKKRLERAKVQLRAGEMSPFFELDC